MSNYVEKEYKIFEMFKKDWALVTAGNLEDFNTCTVAWGSLGTIWTRSGNGSIATVYIHPSRYTNDYFLKNDTFTVSFYSNEYKKQLGYLGSHSGRDEDKVSAVGFTPIETHNSVTFKEAKLTLVCKKLYYGKYNKDNLAQEIKDYYISKPQSFPLDENGEWNPHYEYIGEIIDVIEE